MAAATSSLASESASALDDMESAWMLAVASVSRLDMELAMVGDAASALALRPARDIQVKAALVPAAGRPDWARRLERVRPASPSHQPRVAVEALDSGSAWPQELDPDSVAAENF